MYHSIDKTMRGYIEYVTRHGSTECLGLHIYIYGNRATEGQYRINSSELYFSIPHFCAGVSLSFILPQLYA